MQDRPAGFRRPTAVERLFNASVGALVRLGIGLPDMRVLEVKGRKSGRLYTLPVDLLSHEGRLYLVAPPIGALLGAFTYQLIRGDS